MKKINFIQNQYLKKDLNQKLLKNYLKIEKKIFENIKDENQIFNLLSKNYKFNFKMEDLKKYKRFNNLAIIGMGGSILGAEAIYQFLNHHIKKNVFFFNDINETKLLNFKKEKNFKKTLFLVISKSGNTIETLTNFLSLKVIKTVKNNIIIISEKKNNELFNIANKFDLSFIEHKKFIGGRYSVLSEVGMVPAYLMGVNIHKFRFNFKKNLIYKEKSFLKDSAIKISNLMISKKFNNLILLNYVPSLEKFLYWYQQLIAESLGKKGQGFLPVVSNAPKDHHSLLQLYLDGPKDKLFYIFSLNQKSKLKIDSRKYLSHDNYIDKKSLSEIKISQKKAVVKSFIKNKIPYREFSIDKCDEQALGDLFFYFMLEVIIIGKISGLNPFNQPAVEEVKIFTKKILKT